MSVYGTYQLEIKRVMTIILGAATAAALVVVAVALVAVTGYVLV